MSAVSELCNLVAERNEEISNLKDEIEELRKDFDPSCTASCSECAASDCTDSCGGMSNELDNFKVELKRVRCDIERLKQEKDCLCASTNPDNNKRARLCEELECRYRELEDLKIELERVKQEACCTKCCPPSGPGQAHSGPGQACGQYPPPGYGHPPSGPSQPQCQATSQPQCQATSQPQCQACSHNQHRSSGAASCPDQSGSDKSQGYLHQELTERSREVRELRCELESLKRERALLVEMVSKNQSCVPQSPPCAGECVPGPTRSEQILCELKKGQQDVASLRCELQEMREQLKTDEGSEDQPILGGKAGKRPSTTRSGRPSPKRGQTPDTGAGKVGAKKKK